MPAPRSISFSLLFFKSLSGIGTGIVGMMILLIFVLAGLGTASGDIINGPFLTFTAIAMGFVTAFVTNTLGVYIFGLLDRTKYPNLRDVVRHVILLNILIFVFLLPVYFFVVVGGGKLTSIFMIATLQLIISAQASLLILELSSTTESRENFLAIYGIVFSLLATIIVNLMVYGMGQNYSTAAELATGGSGGKGSTAVLFAILPLMWFFFGFFTSVIEMLYRWIYETWGVDFLNR